MFLLPEINTFLKNLNLLIDTKNRKFAQNTDMQALISNNMEKIKTLCLAHNVKTLFAFGSVCTDKFNDDSDIDLLISFKPMDYGDYADTYFELADKFENLFRRPVDLVTDKSLSNPYFIDSVNQTKTLLYGN
jgi:predicted nucleotidyltransferase